MEQLTEDNCVISELSVPGRCLPVPASQSPNNCLAPISIWKQKAKKGNKKQANKQGNKSRQLCLSSL